MPNYTDPLIWRIVNGQFRCIANVDAIPATHDHYNYVVQASQHYNKAMNFYMQGLIHNSRFKGLAEENPALLRDSYSKMWEHIQLGLDKLEPLFHRYGTAMRIRIMSPMESEKQVIEWTIHNFDKMVRETPRLFALRTPEWHKSQKEWEEFQKEEAEREEKRKRTPKISVRIPRASVVERFRETGREYDETCSMTKEDICATEFVC